MGGAWRWWFSRVVVGVVVGGAHCEGEAGAVGSGSVVALCGDEGQLGFVSVDHDEDGVFSHPSLMSFSLRVYSTRAFMMRAHLLPRTSARVMWYQPFAQPPHPSFASTVRVVPLSRVRVAVSA